MPLAPVTTVRTSPVAWLVTRRLAPVIVPPVASVTTPVSAPVDAVCARPAGVNAPTPKTIQTRTKKKHFRRLEESKELARTHHPERCIMQPPDTELSAPLSTICTSCCVLLCVIAFICNKRCAVTNPYYVAAL